MPRIKYFKVIHDKQTCLVQTNVKGEMFPLQLQLKEQYDTPFEITAPLTILHDCTEHLNHSKYLGSIADEFQAIGAMLALRPKYLRHGLIPEIELILSDWFMRGQDWGECPSRPKPSTEQFRELFGVYTDWADLAEEFAVSNHTKQLIEYHIHTGWKRARQIWKLPTPQQSICNLSERLLEIAGEIIVSSSEGDFWKIVLTTYDMSVYITQTTEPRKWELQFHEPYWNHKS